MLNRGVFLWRAESFRYLPADSLGLVLAVAAVSLLPVAAAGAIAISLGWDSGTSSIAGPAASILFLLIFAAIFAPDVLLKPAPSRSRHCLAWVLLSFAAFTALTSLLSPGLPAPSLAGLIVFIPALSEEIVFRQLLPNRLRLLMRRRVPAKGVWLSAQVVSQASFALAHGAGGHLPASHDLPELARLFVAGIFYANIAGATNVWFAASVHGALNFGLLLSPVYGTGPPAVQLALLGLVGLSLLTLFGFQAAPSQAREGFSLTPFRRSKCPESGFSPSLSR